MKTNVKSLIFDTLTIGFILTSMVFFLSRISQDDLLEGFWKYSALVSVLGVVSAIITIVLNRAGIKTFGLAVFESARDKKVETKPWYLTFWGLQLFIWFSTAVVSGFLVTRFSLYEVFSKDGFGGASRIFSSLFHPEMGVLPAGILAVVETIFIAFVATVLAVPPAFILSFFGAKNIMGKTRVGFGIYVLLRSGMNITRSIEPLIWAIIFSVWVGIGPFAGMLALMIQSIASLTKQYSEIIECVEDGPVEGVLSTGARPLQVIWFAVVPQIVLPSVAFTIYRWDINVRMATVIGLVGGGGIGTMLMQYQGQAQWREVGCLVMIIAAVVWFMDAASAYVREAIK